MKTIFATITAALIATTASASADSADVSTLFEGLLECEAYAAKHGMLSAEEARVCMTIYEALKSNVTSGDYDLSTIEGRAAQYVEYREWRDANEAVFREHITIGD